MKISVTGKISNHPRIKNGLCKVISFALCAVISAALLTTSTAAVKVSAAETASELDQFIAGWGEPTEGIGGKAGYIIDFEDYEAETDFTQLEDLKEDWILENATGAHITHIKEENGNKVLQFAPFSQMILMEGITNRYVFSCNANLGGEQGFGIFIRSTGETAINPYFEDDASGHDIKGIGPAGIYIIPNHDILRCYIKYYDEEKSPDANGKYLNNEVIEIKAPDSFFSGYQRLSFADYGNGARVFVNGKFVASFEFSNVVDGYDELLSECRYYSNVAVFDADGNKVGEVQNAMVCADYSVLALGMRIDTAYIDNISITEYEYKIAGIEIDASSKTDYLVGDGYTGGINIVINYENGTKKNVAAAAEALEGFDTSSVGDKKVKVNYKGVEAELTIHVSEPPKPTEEPKATENANTNQNSEEKSKSNKPLTVGLIVGGVLLAAIAVAVILVAKKKKK